jgi:hypothetical protein
MTASLAAAVGDHRSDHLPRDHFLPPSDLDFYEKALFVKVDVATALWRTQLLCTLRALCFYPL